MIDFWKHVKDKTKEQNTTQEWVCSQTGIILATLRGWITHDRLPDAESAYKIAQTLGTTVEYLVTGKESNKAAEELADLKARLADVLK